MSETNRPCPENRPAVLVVDDDETVRSLAVAVLEYGGYRVSSAVDGEEALERFQKTPEGVALLLTDLAMPRKDGIALIREVRAIQPGLPIVVMSGNLSQADDVLYGIPCIAKPFRPGALLGVVEKRLASRHAKNDAESAAV